MSEARDWTLNLMVEEPHGSLLDSLTTLPQQELHEIIIFKAFIDIKSIWANKGFAGFEETNVFIDTEEELAGNAKRKKKIVDYILVSFQKQE